MNLCRWTRAMPFGLLTVAVAVVGACSRTGLDSPAGNDSGVPTTDATATADALPTLDAASVVPSYIGREYYAVTMRNEDLDQSSFAFSVAISNTSTAQATITITGPSYARTFTLEAGAAQNYPLPWVPPLSCQSGRCDAINVSTPATALVQRGAYHIKSTEPISVYEFNAYDYVLQGDAGQPVYSYTNDASLLLPVEALTGNYRVVSGATWGIGTGLSGGLTSVPGVVAIVGTADGTRVTFAMTNGSIVPGAGLGASGGTVTLDAGDVLQIASALDAPENGYGSDMSGAVVSASAPVEVIGGSDCSYVPADAPSCDHLEQVNLPLETLGTDHLVTLPFNSHGQPRQYVKVVGTADGTTLVASPAQAGLPAALDAGQIAFFETTTDFRLTSSRPIAVGQFMEGQSRFGSGECNTTTPSSDCGDPSMSVAVPTAQFRTGYQFISPPSYSTNWLNVIAPVGASVTVDGARVTGFGPAIGSASYSVAHVALCAGDSCSGVHTASGSQPFGIQVYGYGSYTSYMYPGGLNLLAQ